jgi:hypothetical protein
MREDHTKQMMQMMESQTRMIEQFRLQMAAAATGPVAMPPVTASAMHRTDSPSRSHRSPSHGHHPIRVSTSAMAAASPLTLTVPQVAASAPPPPKAAADSRLSASLASGSGSSGHSDPADRVESRVASAVEQHADAEPEHSTSTVRAPVFH